MPSIAHAFGLLRSARRSPLNLRVQLSLLALEARVQPSTTPITLGAAAQFGVLGLRGTDVDLDSATVVGNVGVSQCAWVDVDHQSSITGNIDEYSKFQSFNRGQLSGTVVVNAALMSQADKDALQASAAAAALSPTKTLREVEHATTVTGNGGLNVINVGGDIEASLTLNGTASDIFIVNVRGDLHLRGNAGLNLAGGVTADHVIYNFVGRDSDISATGNNVINGTLLGPRSDVNLHGTHVNGEIIAGGESIDLNHGVQINAIPFVFAVSKPGISGFAFVDNNSNGNRDAQENGFPNITVTLSGMDNNGIAVNLTTQTATDGSYSFPDLAPGTYTIQFTIPAAGGTVVAGTIGGNTNGTIQLPDTITGIVLGAGAGGVAINYNFAVSAPS